MPGLARARVRSLEIEHGLVSRFRSSHHCAATSFANFGIEGHWQLVDLVWLWFRSPHFGLAAKMMRTSEPPHFVPAPPISAGDRGRVVDVRGLRVENAALANPCLRLGVGFLPVRQKHDS